jgi:hypothetical protein
MAWLALFALLMDSASAVERRPGAVKTSDGMEFKGDVWFNNAEAKVYEGEDAADGRYLKVNQSEIASIVFSIKKSSMEKPWRFPNPGSDLKEYLPGEYPVVELKSVTTLKSGQIVKGHLAACPVYIRAQSRENPMDFDNKKFFLRYQYKGEVGQTMKDIAYVSSIVFDDGSKITGSVTSGKILGTVVALGAPEQCAAYGIKRGRAFEGTVDAAKGTFKIENLPDDVYDVSVLTDKGIYVGMSDMGPTPAEEARPIEAGDLENIDKHCKTIRDFFDEIRALAVKGDRSFAKVLVFQARNKEMYDEEGLKGKKVNRLDIWNWHMRQTEWVINTSARNNLFRYMEPAGGVRREIRLIQKFGAIPVTLETKELKLEPADANVPALVNK